MRRLLPTVLILASILGLTFAYAAWREDYGVSLRILLALPFLLVWLIPVIYWVGEREERSPFDHLLQYSGFLSMGWLSFFLVFTVMRDVLWLGTSWGQLTHFATQVDAYGGVAVLLLTIVAMIMGAAHAGGGPHVREVEIPIDGLPQALDGFRIVQISDLHVGPTIKEPYVRRVARMTNELSPDLVALTGDIVDGSVAELAPHVAPLLEIAPKERVFFITGNHEYYSGAQDWLAYFRRAGHTVLTNAAATLVHNGTPMLVGGVLDPAARMENRSFGPDLVAAMGDPIVAKGVALRILLAHNPKLAPKAAKAGFDLQLSGHTHAGQFFPWTLVTRLVHAPHFAGLSREGKMQVYVSAGTGTWGPPIRLGTRPELTLIKLVRR